MQPETIRTYTARQAMVPIDPPNHGPPNPGSPDFGAQPLDVPDIIPQARPVFGAPLEAPAPALERAHPMALATLPRKDALIDIAAFILWFLLLQWVIHTIAMNILVRDESLDERWVSLVFTLISGVLSCALIWFIVSNRAQPAASVGLCRDRWFVVLGLGLAGAVGGLAVMLFTYAVIWLVSPETARTMSANSDRITSEIPRLSPLGFAGLVSLVAFYEEVVFRGFLLTRIARALGSAWGALLLSSALFAAMHLPSQEAAACIPLFFLALLWGAMTLWRKTVLPAILAHLLFNFTQLMSLYYLKPDWQ